MYVWNIMEIILYKKYKINSISEQKKYQFGLCSQILDMQTFFKSYTFFKSNTFIEIFLNALIISKIYDDFLSYFVENLYNSRWISNQI